MLNMSTNKDYLRCGSASNILSTNTTANSCSAYAGLGNAAAAAAAHAAKTERESIHSGQFMVSQFEAEEAQDDLEEDAEVKMLDPEDPTLSKSYEEPNTCTQVQLYVPMKVAQAQKSGMRDNTATTGVITSHLEIETSLTKLFKCMNLAYR